VIAREDESVCAIQGKRHHDLGHVFCTKLFNAEESVFSVRFVCTVYVPFTILCVGVNCDHCVPVSCLFLATQKVQYLLFVGCLLLPLPQEDDGDERA
jgi:hypothetical protein